jgi:small subunit ribosomal protein S16
MLIIRLQRIGRKNDPSFRVVLTDSKNAAKSGKFLEILGAYNVKKGDVIFKAERINHWISCGAQTSKTVHNLLVHNKIIKGTKKNVLSKKSPTKARKELKKV